MRIITSAFAALIVSFVLPQGALAYNGYVDTVIKGEHPYEQRDTAMRLRKKLRQERIRTATNGINDAIYYHPSFAKVSALHPFYRKGGQSNGGSYAEWRGYMNPILFQELSPDTYCLNFRYQRTTQHRSQPFGQECY